MEFQDRLKALRIQASLTQKQLSEQIGVSVMAIRSWESGVKQPSMKAIISLTLALHTSADNILGVVSHNNTTSLPISRAEVSLLSNYRTLDKHGKDVVETVCELEKTRMESENARKIVAVSERIQRPTRYIPRYRTPSAAGYSIPLDGDAFEMMLADDSVPNDADFAVRIQGDSMAPFINDGETVFVKKTCELTVGEVGIFSVDGAMYCKIYYIDDKRNLTLVSANPDMRNSNVYVDAESGREVVCFGKVLLEERIPFPDYFIA